MGVDNFVLDDVLEVLSELREDSGISCEIKVKIDEACALIKSGFNDGVILDKIRVCLDDICETSSLPSYARTQVWNVSSMIEKL